MDITQLIGGLALSAPAGLNAYLPLLILALAGKFGAIHLNGPYATLTDWWAIGVLLVLVTVELMVDKIPGLDHLNDIINTLIRPAAGALLYMSHDSAYNYVNPIVALGLGAVAAGGVHVLKATSRPVVTLSTAGLGNPLVSLAEDFVAALSAILALFVPLLALLLLVIFLLPAFWLVNRLRKRLARMRANRPPDPPPPPDGPIQLSR
jgi:Domain of unknown function (DUF4126)